LRDISPEAERIGEQVEAAFSNPKQITCISRADVQR